MIPVRVTWRCQRWIAGLLLAVSLLLVQAPPARAAQVLIVAPWGNDSQPGTVERPLASAQEAIYRAVAGDVIQLRGGVYFLAKGLWIGEDHSGRDGAPLIIESYPGETAILDGSAMSVIGDCITIGGRYVIIRSLTCQNSPRAGIVVWGGDHVEIRGTTVHRTLRAGIVAYGSTAYENGRVIPLRAASHVYIADNRVSHTNQSNRGSNRGQAIWGMAIQAMRANNVMIHNNVVIENYGEGIGCTIADQCIVSRNVLHDNYNAELYMDNATHSVFERNLVYTTRNPEHFRVGCDGCQAAPSIGILLGNEVYETANPLEGNAIRNNLVIGSQLGLLYGSYFCRDQRQRDASWRCGVRNTVIVNNTFYATDRYLIYIDDDPDSDNLVIANNIFFQLDQRDTWDAPGTRRGYRFQSNIWYGGALRDGVPSSLDVMADPQLASPGGIEPTSYLPLPGSPAINRGAGDVAPPDDYNGNRRPAGGLPDIGAHERASPETNSEAP